MTPPESPDKPVRGGRMTDFHPMVDARGPPMQFDIRQGLHLSGSAANSPAINHPATRLLVNIGPNVISLQIVASNGAFLTLGDVFGQLVSALKMPASEVEIANVARLGVSAPRGISKEALMSPLNLGFIFAGLSLRTLQNGVAMADCHMRGSM